MAVSSRCICTAIDSKALAKIVESQAGSATYIDPHPWIVARELLDEATAAEQHLSLIFATGDPIAFAHWAFVAAIDVRELHHGSWETRCEIGTLRPVNPIWESIDSIVLAPSAEQLHRERVEPVHIHRQMLTEQHIWPYAVCETPVFIAGHQP